MEKEQLKKNVIDSISRILDDLEKIDRLNYFEIDIKHSAGEVICRNSYTDKKKLK